MAQISHEEVIWDGFHVKSNKNLTLLVYGAALETSSLQCYSVLPIIAQVLRKMSLKNLGIQIFGVLLI